MYAWIYRRLPGPTPVRVLLVVALAAALFLALMEVVFPAVESLMPYTGVAVDWSGPDGSGQTVSGQAGAGGAGPGGA